MIKPTPKRWYAAIRSDPSRLGEALAYYEERLVEGNRDVDISGNLEAANRDQPGLVAYYDAMHTDLDVILHHVEGELKNTKSKAFRSAVENPQMNRKMNTTDIKMFIESDPDVMTASYIVEEVLSVHKQFVSLLEGFEQRGYALSNLVKLRVAGMEEVSV